MKALSIIALILVVINLKAQSTVDSLVLTEEQSDFWIQNLEKEPKSRQLELISKRILSDTNVYVNQYYADRIQIDIDNDKLRGKRLKGYGRPLLVFNQLYTAYINNQTKNQSILKLSELLTDKKIKSVSILKGNQAKAIYGTRAESGVVLLTTLDRKTFNQVKEIDLN